MGSNGDGGYLIPSGCIEASQGLISFGIADNWEFEKHFSILNSLAPIHSYDYSVGVNQSLIKFAKKLFRTFFGIEILTSAFYEIKTILKMKIFFVGRRKCLRRRVVSEVRSRKDISIEQVVKLMKSEKFILKCDIEGFEYEILPALLKFQHRLSLIVIEFHGINSNYELLVNFLSDLSKSHQLVHLHANNYSHIGPRGIPDVMEMTFCQGKPFDQSELRHILPIEGLDTSNSPLRPDYSISFS